MAALLRAAAKLARRTDVKSVIPALQRGAAQAHTITAHGTTLLRAAANQAPHLSGLRFQQTAAADVNPRDLPAFGDSKSNKVRFVDIHAYGDELKRNKNRIYDAATAAGASYSERALIIAMAMVETNTMSAGDHDGKKDDKGGAANYSAINLNKDFLQKLKEDGLPVDTNNLARLNNDANVGEAVRYLVMALQHWGVTPTLNFQRGGYTAFKDGRSYGAEEYRDGLQFIYNKVCFEMPELQTDDQRVEVIISYV